MRVSTMAPVAAFLLVVTGSACGPGTITTTGEEQQTNEDSGPGGGGGGSGSGGSGGPGGGGGSGGGSESGGQEAPPAAGEEETNAPDEGDSGEETAQEESEPADEPIMLELGASHRFEDGFTVTMSPVERRTDRCGRCRPTTWTWRPQGS